MKSFTISCLLLFISIFTFGQDKVFVPNNQTFPTTGGNGMGVNQDKPEAAIHIVESEDKGVALRIDLVEEQVGIVGGGNFISNPDYALLIKRYNWNIYPESNIFSIDGRGRTRIGYNGSNGGEALSIGGNAGVFYNNTNKINLSYTGTTGTQPEFSWRTSSNKNLRFKNANSNKVPLSLSPNGKVGINTEDFFDDHDLYVNGSVYIKGDSPETYSIYIEGIGVAEELVIKLKSSGWGDFVFFDDYPLLPLKELEDFIDKNGHLPGMPTAERVAEDGLQTGETIRLLNIKVEELTLYLLQQQKEIEALRKEINEK